MREPPTDDGEARQAYGCEDHQHDVAVVRPLLSTVDELVQRQQHEERDGENNGNSCERPHEPVNDNL